VLYPQVGVRFNGNSSYYCISWSEKNPFRIQMDEFVPGQNLMGFDTIKLNNSFRDPTFLHEVLIPCP
jgi:hypothetical protein